MLKAASLSFLAFSCAATWVNRRVVVFVGVAFAAAEVRIGRPILVMLFRNRTKVRAFDSTLMHDEQGGDAR